MSDVDMTTQMKFYKLSLKLLLMILLYVLPTRGDSYVKNIAKSKYAEMKKEVDAFIGEEDA